MKRDLIANYDYLLLLPYFLVLFLIARKFARKNAENPTEFYWLLINWWIRMIAGILYAWMIVYYYGYGDPIAYKDRSDEIVNSIHRNWENIKYIFLPVDAFRDYLSDLGYTTVDLSYHTERNFMISRVSALASFFTFNRFLIISLVFTNLAYYGFAILYTAAKKIIKGYNKQLMIGILFIPSCLFWSSGLAKEPLCVIGVGVMFSCLIKLLYEKKIRFGTVFNLIFFSFIVLTVKDYIFFCFAFALVFWRIYNVLSRLLSKSLFIRMIFIMMIVFLMGIVYLKSDMLMGIVTENIGNIVSINMSMYEAMASVKEGGGSFINISDIDISSVSGILSFIPKGLANVFFRPYPWEISNVLMIFTVMENLFFIFLFFRVLVKSRFFTKYLFIDKNFQVFAILFTFSMAFAIAISTFNFGSMVRYKMPFLPFWATFLLIINRKLTINKRAVDL